MASGFQFWFLYFLLVEPWKNDLISHDLSFFISKMAQYNSHIYLLESGGRYMRKSRLQSRAHTDIESA